MQAPHPFHVTQVLVVKALCLVLVFLGLSGCSTHPDSLSLVKRDVELTDFVQYASNRSPGTLAVALHFEGSAPYAAIANEGRQAQFRCHVLDAAGVRLTDTEFGWVFLVGPVALPDHPGSLLSTELSRQLDRYRYKAILYPGLKASTQVNGPADFDLLTRDYEQIRCQLVGVRMIGAFMYSNELTIARSELVGLQERRGTR